jgi:hypothetical protein
MKNKYKKIINKIKKNRNYLLFFFFLILGLTLTLYVEYKFQYFQFKWLGLRVLIASAAIVQFGILPTKFRRKYQPMIFKIFLLVIFLYLVNFLSNLINVYHLYRFSNINNFCQNSPNTCQLVVENFYKFKIYRFVSLTSYFFFYVIFLLIGLLFSEKISNQINKVWKKIPKIKLKYVWPFYFLMTYLIFQQLISVFSIMSKKTVKILATLNVPFEERWEPIMGGRFSFGWIATYSKFINSEVEEDSTILIPNQVAPWEMEGNPYYIRWFLYPRKTVQMLDSIEIPKEAEYILISYGIFGYHKNVFPNFSINKDKIKKIILVNQETLEISFIENQDFHPDDFVNKWGIIKLK